MAKQHIQELLINRLKTHSRRTTPKRLEILEAALNYDGHFSADELFNAMKKKDSKISRASVYNTLDLLSELNIISTRNFGDNSRRYDATVQMDNHSHLVCVDCGSIIEFNSPELEAIQNRVCKKNGFEPISNAFYIYARCIDKERCKNSNEKENTR